MYEVSYRARAEDSNAWTRLIVIPNKRSLRREESGRAARSVAHLRRKNRAFGSLPYQTAPLLAVREQPRVL